MSWLFLAVRLDIFRFSSSKVDFKCSFVNKEQVSSEIVLVCEVKGGLIMGMNIIGWAILFVMLRFVFGEFLS